MDLKNGYKVLYEVIEDKGDSGKFRIFKASATGTLADAVEILKAKMGTYKLVYEKNGKIYGSTSTIPSNTEQAQNDFCFTDAGLNIIFKNPIEENNKNEVNTDINDMSEVIFSQAITFESSDEGGYLTTITDFPELAEGYYMVYIDDEEGVICERLDMGGMSVLQDRSEDFTLACMDDTLMVYLDEDFDLEGEHIITIKKFVSGYKPFVLSISKDGVDQNGIWLVSYELSQSMSGATVIITDSDGKEYYNGYTSISMYHAELNNVSKETLELIYSALEDGKTVSIDIIPPAYLPDEPIHTFGGTPFTYDEGWDCYYVGNKELL